MLCFVKYVMIVNKDVRVLVGWKRGVVLYGDDCGWSCIEGSIGWAVEYGGVVHIVVGVVGKM